MNDPLGHPDCPACKGKGYLTTEAFEVYPAEFDPARGWGCKTPQGWVKPDEPVHRLCGCVIAQRDSPTDVDRKG